MASLRRLLNVALAFTLASSLAFAAPATAWADRAPSNETTVTSFEAAEAAPLGEAPTTDESAGSQGAAADETGPFDFLIRGELETSVKSEHLIAPFSLDSSGRVALKPGNYPEWIDRIDVPSYARQFYDVLVEAVDGDGVRDFLIEDGYYGGTAPSEGAYRSIKGIGAILVGSATLSAVQGEGALAEEMGEYAMAAMAAFDRDHPEVFWLSGAVAFGFSAQGRTLTCYLVLSNSSSGMRSASYTSGYQIRLGIWNRDQRVRTILQGLKAACTQEEAVRYFDRWLREHNEYNTLVAAGRTPATRDPWTCLSALMGRTGQDGPVCEGYARAFKVLCNQVGIPCVLVDGEAGGPHMWNNVQVGNAWYAADVTWNDTGIPANLQTYLLVGAKTIIDGERFDQSHLVENCVYSAQGAGGVAFTNGPVLSETAFPPSAASPVVTVNLPVNAAAPKRKLMSLSLSKTAYTFTGKTLRPTVTVRGEGAVLLKQDRDYQIKISGNQKSVGAYRVTVTGIGDFAGSLSKTYKIKAPTVKKAAKPALKSSKRKTLAVTWKRVSGNVTGYQVQACMSKKFKKAVSKKTIKLTRKTKKAKALKATFTKLKSKKSYYVRVRAYYKVGGKTFYGSWSTVRKGRVR